MLGAQAARPARLPCDLTNCSRLATHNAGRDACAPREMARRLLSFLTESRARVGRDLSCVKARLCFRSILFSASPFLRLWKFHPAIPQILKSPDRIFEGGNSSFSLRYGLFPLA